MEKLWYVSRVSASTTATLLHHRRWTAPLAAALLACAGCAGTSATGGGPVGGSGVGGPGVGATERPGARDANLAGARCQAGPGAPCVCRRKDGDAAEAHPPDADHKRFELRLGAAGGSATLDSPTLGHFTAAGPDETCYYIDVLPGTTQQVTFTARAATKNGGVGPQFDLAEYGPKGPWWYDVLSVRCSGPDGRCNREAAEAWGAEAKTRKRGRVDPCGSTVISHLRWDTSGGAGERDLGLFRDFTVTFTMDVKHFATQFAPRATECVPK